MKKQTVTARKKSFIPLPVEDQVKTFNQEINTRPETLSSEALEDKNYRTVTNDANPETVLGPVIGTTTFC